MQKVLEQTRLQQHRAEQSLVEQAESLPSTRANHRVLRVEPCCHGLELVAVMAADSVYVADSDEEDPGNRWIP